jgi:hypothetical protein
MKRRLKDKGSTWKKNPEGMGGFNKVLMKCSL